MDNVAINGYIHNQIYFVTVYHQNITARIQVQFWQPFLCFPYFKVYMFLYSLFINYFLQIIDSLGNEKL